MKETLTMPPITLDDVIAAVAAEDTEINSAIAFVVSVPALVAAAAATAGIDQTKAAALVADITSQTTAITNAIVTGTGSAVTVPAPIPGVPVVPAPTPTPTVVANAAAAVAAMKKKLGIH